VIGGIVKEVAALSLGRKLALGAIVLVVLAALTAGGAVVGHRISQSKFERERAARLKEAQDHLAAAEKLEKRAEGKEQKAEEMEVVIGQKAAVAEAKKGEIEASDRRAQEQIDVDAKRDADYINRDLSNCERCRDVCARKQRLADAANRPGWQCPADACDEDCPAGQ
jgi:uncharacterized protein HemX